MDGFTQVGDGLAGRLHRTRHLAGGQNAEFHISTVFINNLPHCFGIIKRIRRHMRHFRHGLAELLHGRGNLLDVILLGQRVVRHPGYLGVHIHNASLHHPHRGDNLIHHGAQIRLHGLYLAQQTPHFVPNGNIQLGIQIAFHDISEFLVHYPNRTAYIPVGTEANQEIQDDQQSRLRPQH